MVVQFDNWRTTKHPILTHHQLTVLYGVDITLY